MAVLYSWFPRLTCCNSICVAAWMPQGMSRVRRGRWAFPSVACHVEEHQVSHGWLARVPITLPPRTKDAQNMMVQFFVKSLVSSLIYTSIKSTMLRQSPTKFST